MRREFYMRTHVTVEQIKKGRAKDRTSSKLRRNFVFACSINVAQSSRTPFLHTRRWQQLWRVQAITSIIIGEHFNFALNWLGVTRPRRHSLRLNKCERSHWLSATRAAKWKTQTLNSFNYIFELGPSPRGGHNCLVLMMPLASGALNVHRRITSIFLSKRINLVGWPWTRRPYGNWAVHGMAANLNLNDLHSSGCIVATCYDSVGSCAFPLFLLFYQSFALCRVTPCSVQSIIAVRMRRKKKSFEFISSACCLDWLEINENDCKKNTFHWLSHNVFAVRCSHVKWDISSMAIDEWMMFV